MLCACTRVPEQIVFEEPVAPRGDVSSGRVKDSTLLVIVTQDHLKRRVGSTSFFVAPDKVATNIHAVAGADPALAHVRVKGTTWSIRGVTAYDVKNDLVILEISGKGTSLPLGDSDTIQRGDAISVMGYPNGRYRVTEGSIYRVRRSDKWFQMDVRISGGNSGSPVINSKGEVIGIAAVAEVPFSYAIPSNALKVLLARSGPTEPLTQWCKRRRIRAFVYANQGRDKLHANRYDEAIAYFDKAISLNSDNAWSYYNRGLARFMLADLQISQENKEKARELYAAGIEDCTQAIEQNPGDTTAYHNRALARFKLGKHQAAQENLVTAQQHYQDAIRDWMQMLQLDSENAESYINLGAAKSNLGDLKSEQGDIAAAQRNYQNAIEDCPQAIERMPEGAVAYNNRGYAKYLLGKSEAAIGNTAEARKRYESAILDSDASIQRNSENDYAYHTRGVIKAALGDLEEAIADFDRAIEINPEFSEHYYERGHAKEALGKKEAADIDFKKAKELEPEKRKE